MKRMSVGLVVLVVIFFSAPAFALGPYYVGANYASIEYQVSDFGFPGDFNMTALVLNAGLNLHDHFAIEARLGTGVEEDAYPGLEPKIGLLYGVYARGEYPIDNFKPYLTLGYTWLEVDYDVAPDDKDDSISYGIGADFKFADNLSINLEYLYLLEMNESIFGPFDLDVKSLSFGLKYSF